MLTPATQAIFARDAAAGTSAARHTAYEAHFDATLAALHAMEPERRCNVLRALSRLDGLHCRSGSLTYADTLDSLANRGLPGANRLFDHDREWLAQQFGAMRSHAIAAE